MIEVENLTKYYGDYHALKGVTFSVKKGDILGFLGPNGAGKTTTMRILTCFFPPTSGKASVAGFDVFEEPLEVRKRIGYLPENVPLYKDMTVEDYLIFAAGIKGVEGKKIKGAVAKVMDECVLTDVSYKFIAELSKGYRQRVGLAQALVNEPEVLILDEPTIGLDPKQIIEIRKLIKNLAGRRTVILSTHILPEVSMTCQKVVIINDGRVVAVDTPQNLTSRVQGASRFIIRIEGPSHEVIKTLEAIQGVSKVIRRDSHAANGIGEYTIESLKERDIRRDIAPVIVNKGWALIELRPQEMSLEDIFVKLVTKE
ncbi:MAG: MFS transporter [Deltaproteobacteria bacterium RIFCSPLOWO2_12_FULL_43_16]|nr:MAG: MFS transporter [Deltaproteobacteria bacterium GWA2_43_19]OGQ12743.1 MAG: MFS transporter [Deltaproteobacteria bacterium RIFCSPHIGHO2_02_FULL_43_33]OGQ37523.1 MAG: MFS transporter [Deltaproteobacteria bacterium RIFCSPLOWO2_01_FULL_42_9]OGQ60709.1 MAG: MFS transporter [Deltaproteobacteria bacterium RIFCSPLOWO2_12_FULL_43_16]HBR16308.1 MFS transporter [Deltaproteobacteria bacterium]